MTGVGNDEHEDGGPPLGKRLRLLANEHRRRLLTALLDAEEVTTTELLDEDEDLAPVVVQLYHVHLPMLTNEGLVVWNRDAGTVERGPAYASVRPIVEWLADNADHLRQEADR